MSSGTGTGVGRRAGRPQRSDIQYFVHAALEQNTMLGVPDFDTALMR
jgi:hypothetical protein